MITRMLALVLLLTGMAGPAQARMTGREFGDAIARGFDMLREGRYQEAETLARTLIDESSRLPPRSLANANRLMGAVLFESARYREAEEFLRQSLPVLERELGETHNATLSNIHFLGRVALNTGRYAEAEVHLARYRKLILQSARPGDANLLRSALSLASVNHQLGRYNEAETLFKEAISQSENASDYTHLFLRDRAMHLLARMLNQLRRYEEAESYARQAVELAEKALGGDNRQTAVALDILGQVLINLKREEEAEALLLRALDIHNKTNGPRHTETARTLNNLAWLEARRKRFEKSEALYRQAIEIFRNNSASGYLANALRGHARLLIGQKRGREAVPLYREALDVVDQMFAQTKGLDEATRQGFIGRYGHYYEEMIRLLINLHQRHARGGHDRDALSVLSRTQSRIFTEMLRMADVSRFAGDERFVRLRQDQERQVAAVAELTQRLVLSGKGEDDGKQDPIVLERIRHYQAELRRQRDEAGASLKATEAALWEHYPRYMELTQPRPVTVQNLQEKLLRPGEILLAYALLGNQTAIFVVTQRDFVLKTVPVPRAQIARMVKAVRAPEEGASRSASALATLDPALLTDLYRLLLKPVEEWLRPDARILLVGDGPLHTLPFEMLIPDQDAPPAPVRNLADYGKLKYLGDRFQFVYLPSLSALASQRLYPKPEAHFDRELVSFADPVFHQENSPGDGLAEATRSALAQLSRGAASFPRLPETADEAREIARVLGGKADIYLRAEAQERQAKRTPLKQARYLHFATHGLLGGEFLLVKQGAVADPLPDNGEGGQRNLAIAGESPQQEDEPPAQSGIARGQPALVLTLVGDLQGEDGLLTMAEVIQDLDIGARLVVLSACNTAGETAEAGNGEGFAGLTRAFMYAGARGLLVSHWSVESLSTQQLITALFRHLKQGMAVEQALSSARAEIRKSRGHPYFWAPFVYVGD